METITIRTAKKDEVLLPFQDKQLALGTWQRVILIEFDGPRKSTISLSIS